MSKLKGISEPEQKRKIIGEEFAQSFWSNKRIWTISVARTGHPIPDVIESGFSKGPAAVIKTHHNVGGLPEWLDLKVLEPFRSCTRMK